MEIKILTLDQKDLILKTERQALHATPEIERRMMEWKASWREESLAHYLNTKWCMGIFDETMTSLKAYFLAQPLLFLEGYTQNLWIEHLYFEDSKHAEALIDLAIRYGKDKHLQRVIFKKHPIFDKIQVPSHKLIIKENTVEVFTTKLG